MRTIGPHWVVLTLTAWLVACAEQPSDAPPPADEPKAFYQTLETPPAPVLNPAEAHETFVIAPGFVIELMAAEPLVEDPVAAAWDEDGRIYLAEMRAFMPDTEGTGQTEAIGSVVRLTDTDADGRFDEREVMLDGLVLPRAVRIVNEGLLVAEMGKLWLCPTSTGWSRDIDCAQKRFLGSYGEHQGSVEHAENGLLLGIDNWLYNAKSSRRLKLDDGELLIEPTLFRGQWGITQDDDGRLFYNTNSNLLLGDFYDAQAVVEAGNRGTAGLNARISASEGVLGVRVNPGVNRAYVPGVLREDGRLRNATSASGMVVYRGGALADDDPDVFVAEPAANLVAALEFVDDGLVVRAEHVRFPDATWGERDFMASTDERFRPVDVLNGPDGGLYVIDFYRGVIQDHVFLTEELKQQARLRKLDRPLGMGRIWRLGREPVAGFELPDWASLGIPALIDLLSHPNAWHRSTAQRLLLHRADPSVDTALADVVTNAAPRAALHAIWTLDGRDALDRDLVLRALARVEARVLETAMLAGGGLLEAADLERLATPSVSERFDVYLLFAMQRVMGDDLMALVADRVDRNPDDPYIRAAVQVAARGHELEFIRHLVAAGKWNAEREAATGFFKTLASQFFRAEGAGVTLMLDEIEASGDAWIDTALLEGIFAITREPGFERVVLDEAHALFLRDGGELWSAISRARRGLTWPGDTLAADAKPLTQLQRALVLRGAEFYRSSCANCHGDDGMGVGAAGPPLADSAWVTHAPERLVRIILHGLSGPIEVRGETWDSVMPGHGHHPELDDEVLAGLLTHLRRAWGHAGRALDPEFVATIRAATADRTALWTAAELEAVEINTHYTVYAGRYGSPASPLVFDYDGRDLLVSSAIFNGPLVEQKEDHFLFEPRALRLEFEMDQGVGAVLMNTGDGVVRLPRLQ